MEESFESEHNPFQILLLIVHNVLESEVEVAIEGQLERPPDDDDPGPGDFLPHALDGDVFAADNAPHDVVDGGLVGPDPLYSDVVLHVDRACAQGDVRLGLDGHLEYVLVEEGQPAGVQAVPLDEVLVDGGESAHDHLLVPDLDLLHEHVLLLVGRVVLVRGLAELLALRLQELLDLLEAVDAQPQPLLQGEVDRLPVDVVLRAAAAEQLPALPAVVLRLEEQEEPHVAGKAVLLLGVVRPLALRADVGAEGVPGGLADFSQIDHYMLRRVSVLLLVSAPALAIEWPSMQANISGEYRNRIRKYSPPEKVF
jgi:hypothetical protein